MFRISFDPALGRFVVQVLRFGLFWVNVSVTAYEKGVEKAAGFKLSFETYDDARKHVTSIGLDQLYQDRSENMRREYLAGRHIQSI